MISVDAKEKVIRFKPEEVGDEVPPERTFEFLSAYVCPLCKEILAAYFKGYLSETDIAYYEKETRYKIGSVPGGHYMKSNGHSGYGYGGMEKCKWEAFRKRGITANLRAFVEKHDVNGVNVVQLAGRVEQIRGFAVVQDICGRDGPMLLFCDS